MNATDEILGPSLASNGGERLAIICRDRRLTFTGLNRLANRFGNAILAAEISRGEPVLILLRDTPELVAAYLGIMRAGAVTVALNTRLAAKDLAYIIADSGARLVLADGNFLSLLAEARALARQSLRVVATGGQDDDFDAFLAGQPEELISAEMDPEEPALWAYTSGTTGQPKGVVHVHASIPLGEKYVREVLEIQPGDRMFATSKLFFGYALGQCLIGGLRLGATIILYDGWPDAAAAAQVIEREQPDVVLSVPALYGAMLREKVAASEAFRRVRTYVSAGERLPEKLGREWMGVTGSILLDALGATETIYLFMSTTRASLRLGSCGRPMPWTAVRLTTADGEDVTRPDEPGHLWVRTPSLFRQYNNRPEATAAVLNDGWWRTGDIFSVDADGYWRHEGRSDEMLKVSGQWVSPAEVEEVALSVPGIVEAAAVGIPNRDGLVRLALFAVAAVGESTLNLESRIVETLRRNLAVYKCPRNVRFVEAIPRTATGKVQRFKLRELGV